MILDSIFIKIFDAGRYISSSDYFLEKFNKKNIKSKRKFYLENYLCNLQNAINEFDEAIELLISEKNLKNKSDTLPIQLIYLQQEKQKFLEIYKKMIRD